MPGSRERPINEDLGSVPLPTEVIKLMQENQLGSENTSACGALGTNHEGRNRKAEMLG